MTRAEYLNRVIDAYLQTPDTPEKARTRDWAIAGELFRSRVQLRYIEHAIQLATIRRRMRPPGQPPLEPIRSLA